MNASKRTRIRITVTAILAGGAITGIAVVSPAQAERRGGLFERLDRNGDGVVEQSELDARRAEAFDKLDVDGNDSVSREEFMARESRAMKRFDADGDGRITREEVAARRHMRSGKHGGTPPMVD